MDVITTGQSTAIFLCIRSFVIFSMMTTEQTKNNQPGDPRASPLLISEKAVFCIAFHKKNGYLLDSRQNDLKGGGSRSLNNETLGETRNLEMFH